jgi:hypothetical protein
MKTRIGPEGLEVEKVQDEMWIARDGRKLLVGEMDEDHVRNALRMILRARRRAKQLHQLQKSLDFFRKLADELDDDRIWGND